MGDFPASSPVRRPAGPPVLAIAAAASAALAPVATAAVLAWHSLTDLDIWFHLRAGQDLLAGRGFPSVNTYAFTDPGHPWLNHEWMFQLVVAALGPSAPLDSEQTAGWNLLRLVLIVALVLVLLLGDGAWHGLRSRSGTGTVLRASVAVMAGLLLLWPRFNLRPELVSYIFFVLVVRWTDDHFRRPAPGSIWRDGSLWRFFAAILIWAQCHGFAAIGLAVVLLGGILRSLPRSAKSTAAPKWGAGAVWAPAMVAVAALLLTPNHWRGLLFPIRALTQLSSASADLQGTVSELVPLLATPNSLGLTLVAFKFSLLWGVVWIVAGWGRVSPLRVLLFVATAAAAFASQRNLGLYALAFVLLHTGWRPAGGTLWWRRFVSRSPGPRTGPWLVPALAAAAVVTAAVVWIPAVITNDFYLAEGVGRRFGGGTTPATYPRTAAANLSADNDGRVFANLDAAAFLLGTTAARPFVDGRTEAYPAARWAAYRTIRAGGPAALSLLSTTNVSATVLALASGAFRPLAEALIASPAWQAAAADDAGVLFLPRLPGSGRQDTEVLQTAARKILAGPAEDPTRRADFCLAAADLLTLAGNTDAARDALTAGLQERPDHPNLNHNLGNQLLAAGDFAGALPHFQRAFARNGRLAGSALNAGVCQLRLQQPAEAAASFRRALAVDPRQVGGWVNLAIALRSTGQPEAALAALEKALALRPDDARLQGQLKAWRREGG